MSKEAIIERVKSICSDKFACAMLLRFIQLNEFMKFFKWMVPAVFFIDIEDTGKKTKITINSKFLWKKKRFTVSVYDGYRDVVPIQACA